MLIGRCVFKSTWNVLTYSKNLWVKSSAYLSRRCSISKAGKIKSPKFQLEKYVKLFLKLVDIFSHGRKI